MRDLPAGYGYAAALALVAAYAVRVCRRETATRARLHALTHAAQDHANHDGETIANLAHVADLRLRRIDTLTDQRNRLLAVVERRDWPGIVAAYEGPDAEKEAS